MNEKKYPIFYYNYKICIHCGSESVVPIDKFGRENKIMIYPITQMRCNRCNREYFIKWIKSPNDQSIIPICCSETDKFNTAESIIDSAITHKRSVLNE